MDGRPAAPADELARLRAELNRAAPGLDLTDEFIEAGRTWTELDDDGTIVHRNTGA